MIIAGKCEDDSGKVLCLSLAVSAGPPRPKIGSSGLLPSPESDNNGKLCVWELTLFVSLCDLLSTLACAFYSKLRKDSAWLDHFGGLLHDHNCTPPLEARQSLNHIIHILHTSVYRQTLDI